jgi:hypothetical protein
MTKGVAEIRNPNAEIRNPPRDPWRDKLEIVMSKSEKSNLGEEMKRDLFYIWFIPLLWCGFTVVSYFHPGDADNSVVSR